MNDFYEWCQETLPGAVRQDDMITVGDRKLWYIDLNNEELLTLMSSPKGWQRETIMIYSDDWSHRPAQWKSAIKAQFGLYDRFLYARDCDLREVNWADAKVFLDANHVQTNNKISVTFFGLYNDGELLGLTSLAPHSRHTVYNLTVMDRMCFKTGTQVRFGMSRLIASAAKWAAEREYDEIITFSDNRWAVGNSYGEVGFKFDVDLKPDYFYVKDGKKISKQSQKKSNVDCPETMTEYEWATTRGLCRLYDMGKKRWALNLRPEDHEMRRDQRSRIFAKRIEDGELNSSRIRGVHKSPKAGEVHYASSYELRCMVQMDADDLIKNFRRCEAFKVSENKRRVPDFWVNYEDGTSSIWEIKAKSTLELPYIQEQLEDSRKYAEEKGVSYRIWTEDDAGLSSWNIIAWAKKHIVDTTNDVDMDEYYKRKSREKTARSRAKAAQSIIMVTERCDYCETDHQVREKTRDKNVAKHGRYMCKREAGSIAGKAPKLSLRTVNPYAANGKKECVECHEILEIYMFENKPAMFDGKHNTCRTCRAPRKTEWNKNDRNKKKAEMVANGTQLCWRCRTPRPLSEFGEKHSNGGLKKICNCCADMELSALSSDDS